MYKLYAYSPGLQGYIKWDGLSNDLLEFELTNESGATAIEKQEVAESYSRSLTTLTEYVVDVETVTLGSSTEII